MQTSSQATRFRFADLTLDVGQRRVARDGQALHFGKLTYEMLVALVEAAPNVVTHDRLAERVWSGRIATPETVAQRVKLLRVALDDDPSHPRYVEVVRGQGYRLIPPVKRESETSAPVVGEPASGRAPAGPSAPVSPRTPEGAPSDARPSRRPHPWLATGAESQVPVNWRWLLAACVGAALLLWFTLGRQLAGPPARSPAAGGHRSIAVLPFVDMSAAKDQGYLADGIAEEVRSRLAQSKDLRVISRSSSFLFRDKPAGVRDIADKLDVSHVLEGSVRRSGNSLRITAQLIAAADSSHLWSMRFDRTAGDIFAIQDEISLQVTRALELSLTPGAMERMTRAGTTNLEAYLEFLQGHALLATNRVSDASAAIARFERAAALDPRFAAAYLGAAEAALYAAEFEITDDRQSRFESARRRGQLLVEKALSIDPGNGEAYLQRAHLRAFEDLSSAEADYRRGLELSPNSAEGYARLAEVLYTSPHRRDEALELLDRARRLDPLEPAYDVRKAVYLYDERSDPEAARELLRVVVARSPRYAPALARLCETSQLIGDLAEAIRYCEEALALDPLLEESRRFLIHLYLLLGEPHVAETLVDSPDDEPTLRALPILIDRRDWQRAGEVAYRALELRTTSPAARWYACSAIRMHARTTGNFARAEAALGAESGIAWEASGNAVLPDVPTHVRDAAIGLADVLLQSGQEQRGRRLLASILARLRHEVGELGRPEYWYVIFHPAALAMNGDNDAAIGMLERAVSASAKPVIAWWQLFEIEPAFEELRGDARFKAFRARVQTHIAVQQRELARLRADGLVPDRTADRGG